MLLLVFITLVGTSLPLLGGALGQGGDPNNCGPNEVLSECYHGCEPTCQEPDLACTMECGPGGCQCAKGHLRDSTTGKCVKEDECPPKNGGGGVGICKDPNEVWSTATNWCCLPTCQTSRACNKMCLKGGGCVCKPGFKKDENTNVCVPEAQCPVEHQCGVNESWVRCAIGGCRPSCKEPNPKFCPMSLIACLPTMNFGACRCTPGYLMDTDNGNRCVAPSDCPKNGTDPRCPDPVNEEWSECANGCEPSCTNLRPICPAICPAGGGCRCRHGHVRERIPGGKCIPQEECAAQGGGGGSSSSSSSSSSSAASDEGHNNSPGNPTEPHPLAQPV